MDLSLPTLAALLTMPLHVTVCEPGPCRTVEIRAEGDRVVIVGDATHEQVLSAVLRTMLQRDAAEAKRYEALRHAVDALPTAGAEPAAVGGNPPACVPGT